eukprot:COSAG01_NODE_408_length_17382_cov_6.231431_6_plen_44_part_00
MRCNGAHVRAHRTYSTRLTSGGSRALPLRPPAPPASILDGQSA